MVEFEIRNLPMPICSTNSLLYPVQNISLPSVDIVTLLVFLLNLNQILNVSITIALDVDEFKFRFKLLLIEHTCIFNENIKELQPLSIIL